jgi:prophage DNA circulation protein
MFGRETAKLDGFTLEIETIRDTVEKSIHEHEFPYRDGSLLEDMGAKAREISFRCYFYGPSYNDHFRFYDHVCKTSDALYELEHPTYGLVLGKIRNVTIERNDLVDTALIDIDFIEELQGSFEIFPPPVNIIQNLAEEAFELGQIQQMAEVAADFVDVVGSEAQSILGAVLNPASSLVNSFVNVSISCRAVLNTIDDAMDTAENILSSVTIPVNEMVSIVEYPSTLPGRIVSSLASIAARYAESIENLAGSPEQYISNLAAALESCIGKFSNDDFPMQKHMTIACAQILALKTAIRYSEDEECRSILRQIEKTPEFDLGGKYLFLPESPQVMNSLQLEKTLAAVRSSLQDAITVGRSITALKDMAKQLLDHVRIVKLESENIIVRTIFSEMPLHLICLREGLSYEFAERIYRINTGIKNPSFIIGEINVYA